MNGCMGTGDQSVSVIILTYGNYSGLKRTVQSVIEQDCQISSIVVSDDGSDKPFPQELVRTYANRVAFYRNEQNLGTVKHMNKRAAEAKTKYIKFLGCGDAFSDRSSLSKLLRFAIESHAVITASQVIVCSSDLSKRRYLFPNRMRAKCLLGTAEEQFTALAVENLIGAAGMLFQRSFFDAMGGFSEDYKFLEDWPTWIRYTRDGNKIAFLNEVTALYAAGGISSRSSDAYASLELRADMLQCFRKEILPNIDRISSRRARESICYHYDLLMEKPEAFLWRCYFSQQMKRMIKLKIKALLR